MSLSCGGSNIHKKGEVQVREELKFTQLDIQCSNIVIRPTNSVSKIHISEGFIVLLSLFSDADDTGTELRMKTQRGGTSLPTPAFPLQLQGSTRSTTSYYVNEGLGPISVNDGDQGNELSHEYESISANSIPMAANPAYQSTSYPMQQYFTGCHLGQEFRLCKHSQRRPHLT